MSRYVRDFFAISAIAGFAYATIVAITMWAGVATAFPWPGGMVPVLVVSMIVGVLGLLGVGVTSIRILEEPVFYSC